VFSIQLKGHEVPVLRQGAGKPDGTIGAQGTDLENAPGALNQGQEGQEFALEWGDINGRQTGLGIGAQAGIENGVAGSERIGDEGIHGGPGFLVHTGQGSGERDGGQMGKRPRLAPTCCSS